MTFRTKSGRLVTVGRQLAAGGEGEVFAVMSPEGTVLKKYRPEVLAKATATERKLRAMVASRPAQWQDDSGHVTLAWPTDVVMEDGRFTGFLMPVVDTKNTVELHQVANPTDRRSTAGANGWTRGFTWKYLVRTAANLAQATHTLHESGAVIGDFNERNILVTSDARVTLIDCDSMQVSTPWGDRYLCRVGRLDFTPPELLNANWETTVRQPSSDLFALAIHVYQLLMEGEHPFRGTWKGTGDKPDAPILARQGDWAHKRGGPLSPRRRAISGDLLPQEIETLFRRAFEDGASRPSRRPTALEWHTSLAKLESSLRQCKNDHAHFYPAAHRTCPWCQHEQQVRGSARPTVTGRPPVQNPLPTAMAPNLTAPAAAVQPGGAGAARTGTIRVPPAASPRASTIPAGILTDTGLKASAGRTGLFMASTGSVIGAGWLFGALTAATLAGPAALLSWVVGGVAVLALSLVHAELCGMFPVAGGLARFPARAFGSVVGAAFGWTAWLQAAAVTPIEVLATEYYLAQWEPGSWGSLVSSGSVPTGKGYLCAIALTALFTWVNWAGLRALTRLNNLATWWKLAIPIIIGIELLTHFHGVNFKTAGTWMPYGARGVLSAVSSGGIVFAYLGFEQAGQFAGESRNPQRDVPWAIVASVVAATVLYVLLQTSFIGALPAGDLAHGFAGLASDPGVDQGFLGLAGTAGLTGALIGLLRATPAIATAGTALAYSGATPRLSYGLARSGLAPAAFAKVNRNGVPGAGLLAAFAASMLFTLPGQGWNQTIGDLTTASALMYAAAPLCLGAFRLQFPAQRRPYRLPNAGFMGPATFAVASLIAYWSGWDAYWRIGVALIIGAGFLLATARPGNHNPKAVAWLVAYLTGMGVLTRFGQYAGGTGTLPMWWDMVIVALFSVVIYFWAVSTRL